jgi:hypothetical protein
MEASQGHVGGADLSGVGEQIVDYAFSTEGDARFMVFVEIKTPTTNLIHGPPSQEWCVADCPTAY